MPRNWNCCGGERSDFFSFGMKLKRWQRSKTRSACNWQVSWKETRMSQSSKHTLEMDASCPHTQTELSCDLGKNLRYRSQPDQGGGRGGLKYPVPPHTLQPLLVPGMNQVEVDILEVYGGRPVTMMYDSTKVNRLSAGCDLHPSPPLLTHETLGTTYSLP